jgi:hypothetical protein
MSPRAGRDTLSHRERVGVREPCSTLAMACVERFMESGLFEIDLLTGDEPGIPEGGDAPLYGRRDARRYGRPVHGEGAKPRRSSSSLGGLSAWRTTRYCRRMVSPFSNRISPSSNQFSEVGERKP